MEEARGQRRWSASKKAGVVVRLLPGEDLETVSREPGVAVHELVRWRDAFIEGGKESLKGRPASPVEREHRQIEQSLSRRRKLLLSPGHIHPSHCSTP